jgi:hypothetical protein
LAAAQDFKSLDGGVLGQRVIVAAPLPYTDVVARDSLETRSDGFMKA